MHPALALLVALARSTNPAQLAPAGSIAPAATPASAEHPNEHHLDWLALPIANYDSDDKLGLGAAGQLQWAGGVEPYRHQLAFQVFFTSGGVQSHWVRYDAPRLLGTPLRLWARAEYHRERFEPYYGAGNQTSAALSDHPELSGERPFLYDRSYPYLRLGGAWPLGEHLSAFTFASFRRLSIRPYAGSLLEEQQPLGIAGGNELEGSAGFYVDTRDAEVNASRGSYDEFAVRGVSDAIGSSYTYAGLTGRQLLFFGLPFGSVMAIRTEFDYLTRGAPFYALAGFGGIDVIEGIGGQSSARGIPKDRFVGRLKLLGNAELRVHLTDFTIFKQAVALGVVGFVDVGRVFQLDGDDGPWWLFHPGYGAGVRLWRRSFVVRLDVGSSAERALNIYVLFGQMF